MKRFRSSFTRLHRVRQQAERAARMTLQRRSAEYDSIAQRVTIQRLEADRQSQEACATMTGCIPAQTLLSLQTSRRYLETQIASTRRTQAEASDQLQEALQEYELARKETKVVERVLTKQQAEYHRAAVREGELERFEQFSARHHWERDGSTEDVTQ